MSFFSRLADRIVRVDSLLCIGLDPHPEDLPSFTAKAAKSFCMRLIDATVNIAAAYKPNAAFFEALGPDGIQALKEVINAVPEEIPVILDVKRGDIASTAAAYAAAAFQVLGADAVTINPYLGYEQVEPFLIDTEKGVFLLCKTSNRSAADLQDLAVVPMTGSLIDEKTPFESIPLYIEVARLANAWNVADNLGLVVGATQLGSLSRIRAEAPDLWILAPGVGAQGGDLGAALQAGLRRDGSGMLIPVSRAISRAAEPGKAASQLKAKINHWREHVGIKIAGPKTGVGREVEPISPSVADLADGLLQAGCIKFGSFTLKSGLHSPIYIDLRRLVGDPQLLQQVAQAYMPLLKQLTFDHLAALPYAALPIATTISLLAGWSMIYPRKETKDYGTMTQIEGVYQPGDLAVVIDDLISTGGSKFEGIHKLTAAGLVIKDIVVLIDRSPDGSISLAQYGYQLHAVATLPQFLDHYQRTGAVEVDLIQAARGFLDQQKDQAGTQG